MNTIAMSGGHITCLWILTTTISAGSSGTLVSKVGTPKG
jgi:hypothetical protein